MIAGGFCQLVFFLFFLPLIEQKHHTLISGNPHIFGYGVGYGVFLGVNMVMEYHQICGNEYHQHPKNVIVGQYSFRDLCMLTGDTFTN